MIASLVARTLLALSLLATLAGCWAGQAWFDASEGVAAIPDGTYRLSERGSPPEGDDRLIVRHQPDGSLRIEGPDTPWRAVLVPLDPAASTLFVVQLQEQDRNHPRNALFLLLDTAGARYRVAILGCTGAAQDAARASGGRVSSDPQSAASCIFADRATLLVQLRAAAREPPALDLELVRVDR